ncbi:hypothetical protein WICMUC_000340 [Wickerhamomyces mucosus]|uniref:Uncharacterized protein n=1 Tax=Wickerhamomyces mucosus TaxID=1378264 RepID=A0A9P8Q053_9ASCO|nr:hypothetical protein WICMUC_000340 [Wickerhamomyces mucosus]
MNLSNDHERIPVELTTAEGYNEFVKSPLCHEYATVFPDNNMNQGYVIVNNEIVASVTGDARIDLFNNLEVDHLYSSTTNKYDASKATIISKKN